MYTMYTQEGPVLLLPHLCALPALLPATLLQQPGQVLVLAAQEQEHQEKGVFDRLVRGALRTVLPTGPHLRPHTLPSLLLMKKVCKQEGKYTILIG